MTTKYNDTWFKTKPSPAALCRYSVVTDLLPLTELPHLSRLSFEMCNLGFSPCLSHLTQLQQLALSDCALDQDGMLDEELNHLLQANFLTHLEVIGIGLAEASYNFLPDTKKRDNMLCSLLLSAQDGFRLGRLNRRFTKLRVLALPSLDSRYQAALLTLTGLEALSLAGLGEPGLDVTALTTMGRLRCARPTKWSSLLVQADSQQA